MEKEIINVNESKTQIKPFSPLHISLTKTDKKDKLLSNVFIIIIIIT